MLCAISQAGKQSDFVALCRLTGLEELVADPRFKSNAARVEHSAAISRLLEAGLQSKTAGEWLPLVRAEGITCGPVNKSSDVFHDAQVQARHMALRSPDGRFAIAGNPIKISGFPQLVERPNPPALDADREAIVALSRL